MIKRDDIVYFYKKGKTSFQWEAFNHFYTYAANFFLFSFTGRAREGVIYCKVKTPRNVLY